ncbi:hypothetical protein [Pseudovibrio sp. JE062]|uniref:hypothetical protein n=1 Tax=Pseudovibrio sp. JE062 TaxID=439495 RepID=UPI000186B694|nr:hypothetical protein [Pseudovibrio sp. JE062]EEA95769.1 hypothetical protein PJE062_4807 [Pseudovibrio sp. JE062]
MRDPEPQTQTSHPALDTGSPLRSVRHDGEGTADHTKQHLPSFVIPHKRRAMRDPMPQTQTSPLDTGSPLRSVRHDGSGTSKTASHLSAVFPHSMRDPEHEWWLHENSPELPP